MHIEQIWPIWAKGTLPQAAPSQMKQLPVLLKPANVLFVDSPTTLEHKYRLPENIFLFLPGSVYLQYTLVHSNKVGYKGILSIIFPLLSIKTIINGLQGNICSEFMTVTY